MSKNKWKVTGRIFDNLSGKYSIGPAADDEESRQEERAGYDLYVDVFDTETEAREFYQECLAEG